jgi:hypothetical protein
MALRTTDRTIAQAWYDNTTGELFLVLPERPGYDFETNPSSLLAYGTETGVTQTTYAWLRRNARPAHIAADHRLLAEVEDFFGWELELAEDDPRLPKVRETDRREVARRWREAQ